MSVKTGGPIRGLISRWLVRFEDSQQIFQVAFLAVTAASTTTTALELIGYGNLAPYVLGAGVVGSPLFAFGYVESGVYNRKNRERMDRGDNFSGPGMLMGNDLQARAFASALAAHDDGRDPEEAAAEAVRKQWRKYRNGVDVQELERDDHSEVPA